MEKSNTIIVQESVLGSIVKDIVTFGSIVSLLYFNHRVLSGNGWLDFLFIVFAIMLLGGRYSSRVFMGSKEDAIEWLKSK